MSHLSSALIAPCGMNCGLCIGYLRKRNPCAGCRGDDTHKPPHCVQCRIKHCEHLAGEYCYACDVFPCRRLKQLDERYRTKYHMSMLDNLNNIHEQGVEEFVKQEETRWACPKCGEMLCVHRAECLHCGEVW